MAVDHHKGHESGAKLPLGNYDYLFAFALNARFGPGMELVGALRRHQDVPKLAVDALWKFHF
jgi:hypothetical protein